MGKTGKPGHRKIGRQMFIHACLSDREPILTTSLVVYRPCELHAPFAHRIVRCVHGGGAGAYAPSSMTEHDLLERGQRAAVERGVVIR